MTERAVFLDRDGVINRAIVHHGKPYPPSSVHDLEILPGVREALSELRKAGFFLIVVTNQPDVARGSKSRHEVDALHRALQTQLPLDEFRVCYHDDPDRCSCRKPKPGMLLKAAEEHGLDLSKCYMVGDRWRDIGAGKRAGCHTILIDYGYSDSLRAIPDARATSLKDATRYILEHAQGDLP